MAGENDRAQQAAAADPADSDVAVALLRAALPGVEIRTGSMRGQGWAIVPAEAIVAACRLLRDDPETRFAMLVDVTAVDLLPRRPRFEVVYQLLSLARNARFRLKVELEDGPAPEVPSVTGIWSGANAYEREIFDLMGIRFSGHPDLRRILLPDDWIGHPLRYDHPLGGEEVGFTS